MISYKEYFGDWVNVININILNSILKKLDLEYLHKTICPDKLNVFKAFKLCNYKDCKVIMIGCDPYPQKGVATGILFGNKKETENISPSLQVIKDAVIDIRSNYNNVHFDLTLESWAKQGILMLNSALTVEMNKIGSHIMLWRPFIAEFLKSMSLNSTGIIYVLFGEQAKTFKPYINNKFNFILEEYHPSYYVRIKKDMPATIFNEINKLVKGKYNQEIIWYHEYNV